VKQGGKRVTSIDPKTKKEVELVAGEYEIALSTQKEGLRLSTDRFTLARGDKKVVEVWREPKGGPQALAKVYLSDMNEFESRVSWGRFGKKGALGFQEASNGIIVVRGKKWPNGISMHAPSSVKYQLGKVAEKFVGEAAINDAANFGIRAQRPLIFKVLGDGKALWTSKPMTDAGQVQTCEVNVLGVDILELRAETEDRDQAQAVWLDPYIITKQTAATGPTTRPEPKAQKGPAPTEPVARPEPKSDPSELERRLAKELLASVKVENLKQFVPISKGPWKAETVPVWLKDRTFSEQQQPPEVGVVKFVVESDGIVMLAVTSRWRISSGNASGTGLLQGWYDRAKSREDLLKDGWREAGSLGNTGHPDSGNEWPLFWRQCRKGESFNIRTEKYIAPVIIR
jgi:hypothetical protein